MMSEGHYTAYVKSNEFWSIYDDSNVYPIDEENVKSKIENAYMLFYIRR